MQVGGEVPQANETLPSLPENWLPSVVANAHAALATTSDASELASNARRDLRNALTRGTSPAGRARGTRPPATRQGRERPGSVTDPPRWGSLPETTVTQMARRRQWHRWGIEPRPGRVHWSLRTMT